LLRTRLPTLTDSTADVDSALRERLAEMADDPLTHELRPATMLGIPQLNALRLFARLADGPVLEIGPYIGGSTSALGYGIRENARRPPLHTVEPGGAHPSHPTLPSADILADLRRHLTGRHLWDVVTLHAGFSWDVTVRRAIIDALEGQAIAVFFVDADGGLARDLSFWAPYLREDCVVVFDDYERDPENPKTSLVSDCVDAQVARGTVRPFTLLNATWVGQLTGAGSRTALAADWRPFQHEEGLAWRIVLSTREKPDDMTRYRGSAQLFEDERALGPAHSPVRDIAALGGGRFSFWSATPDGVATPNGEGLYLGSVYFASSDGSDPNTNGRTYRLLAGGETYVLTTRDMR
jgi:hypothetical protein